MGGARRITMAAAPVAGRGRAVAAVESALARKLNRFFPLGRDELAALAGHHGGYLDQVAGGGPPG